MCLVYVVELCMTMMHVLSINYALVSRNLGKVAHPFFFRESLSSEFLTTSTFATGMFLPTPSHLDPFH
jgi:hypothetical protein